MFKAFNKRELKYYDLFHQDKDYEGEAKRLPLVGKTVLEIGSGTGLMTRELKKLGYKVTTVDPNASADYKEYPLDDKYFDNTIALYDVGNYMKPKEWKTFKRTAQSFTENLIYQIWDLDKVKFFTKKEVEDCTRVRLGIKLFGRAYLLFIYWGRGLALAFHKLYLHEN